MWQKCIECAWLAQGIMTYVTMHFCNSSLHIHGQRRGVLHYCLRRNEVRWRPGQEARLAPLCSNLRSFGRKYTVLKKVAVTLLGIFGAVCSDSASPVVILRPIVTRPPGNYSPLAPSLRSWTFDPLSLHKAWKWLWFCENEATINYIIHDDSAVKFK